MHAVQDNPATDSVEMKRIINANLMMFKMIQKYGNDPMKMKLILRTQIYNVNNYNSSLSDPYKIRVTTGDLVNKVFWDVAPYAPGAAWKGISLYWKYGF